MLIKFKDKEPVIDERTFVAEGVKLIGDVEVGEFSSIWYNTVIRGDVGGVKVGKYSNIQDGTVVHVGERIDTIVGDYVTVGHNVILHGATVEDNCMLGMGCIVLNNAYIGSGSIIGAGAVVKEGMVVPRNSLVVGVPGKVVKVLAEDVVEKIKLQAIYYKTLWTEDYGLLKNCGGDVYKGEELL